MADVNDLPEPKQYGAPYSERNPPPNVQDFRRHEKLKEENIAAQKESSSSAVKQSDGLADAPILASTRAGATDDVPIGAEKSNVLLHPTPDVDFGKVIKVLQKDTLLICYVVFGAIMVLNLLLIGGGWRAILKSTFPASGVAAGVYFVLESVVQKEIEYDQTPPKVEKLKFVPESVEWMNTLTATLWATLQQEFFDNIASQANDVIKGYGPAKIVELGHGVSPVRVLSMRSLPDEEFGALVPAHGIDRESSLADRKAREKAIEREEGGIFYNLEIAVAYHARPNVDRKLHMHIDILAGPLPIFVVVNEFVATIRLRLQMHPDLPFLKNVTFALTEPPRVDSSVSIGVPWAFDLLNLPIIDSVLKSQIDKAAADFVQPKSMSLDMTVYIGGSDEREETTATGLLIVKIHRAIKLARQDTRGPGADPYLTIAFSKYEKPMYATRIIKGDRNPVWEESAVIMISAEHIKRKENVLLRLWDSDTMGSDDIAGSVEFPLLDLVMKPGKMHKRKDQLQGDVAGTDAEGILEWEIGYFEKTEFHEKHRTERMDAKDHRGQRTGEKAKPTALNTVPDSETPTGILGLTIHQCINVKVNNPPKKSMGQVKVQTQDSDGEDDDGEMEHIEYVPSLYCTAHLNDRYIYGTRVKSITSAPTFNSTTEQFIRDWRLATVTIGVWDTRKHEDDVLVGVVVLKLSEVFTESSSLVRFYDLRGGCGTGRMRLGLIFRSVATKLDKNLLGFSAGTFTFTSSIKVAGNVNTQKLKVRASGAKRNLKGAHFHEWELEKPLSHIPVLYRYLSPVVLEFSSLLKDKQYAVLWLFKLVDGENTHFELPVYKTDNPDRLTQNVVSQADDHMILEKVGTVAFNAKFSPGIDDTHEAFLDAGGFDDQRWRTFQVWKAASECGLRSDEVKRS
ncbi:hypothetical protein PYCC9005_004117 [Savitreella phatthalungensis]